MQPVAGQLSRLSSNARSAPRTPRVQAFCSTCCPWGSVSISWQAACHRSHAHISFTLARVMATARKCKAPPTHPTHTHTHPTHTYTHPPPATPGVTHGASRAARSRSLGLLHGRATTTRSPPPPTPPALSPARRRRPTSTAPRTSRPSAADTPSVHGRAQHRFRVHRERRLGQPAVLDRVPCAVPTRRRRRRQRWQRGRRRGSAQQVASAPAAANPRAHAHDDATDSK